MADFLHEEIVCDILARLPAKPLLRFRCVSTHWNRMLKDPNFMKLRARKIILLPLEPLHLIDHSVPPDDTANSIVRCCYPLGGPVLKFTRIGVIGTFNGICILRYGDALILYNPFTRKSKKLPPLPTHCLRGGYGFGYGASSDDLKVVRFQQHYKTCDVYSFKENSWTSWSTSKYNIFIKFQHDVGTFANGFLYWIAYYRDVLIALDVKDMLLSEIDLPFKGEYYASILGTIDGCLCALHHISEDGFDMWVMREQKQWSKIYSFELPLNATRSKTTHVFCILEGRRILMVSPLRNLIIYDLSKDIYRTLNFTFEDHVWFYDKNVLEYVETLVSPQDMCSLLRKKNKSKRSNKDRNKRKYLIRSSS